MSIKQPEENRQPPHQDAESILAGPSQPGAETHSLPTTEHLQEELQRVQQALTESRNSEQLLAGLIESAMDAIISVDESQHIVQFNPAAERMFGLTYAEALGQPIDALLPENARRHHAEHIRAFADTGVFSRELVGSGCVRGRRANGELFPVEPPSPRSMCKAAGCSPSSCAISASAYATNRPCARAKNAWRCLRPPLSRASSSASAAASWTVTNSSRA